MHLHLQEWCGSSHLSRLCMGSLCVDAVSLLSCIKIDTKYYFSFPQVLLFSLAVPIPPSLGGIHRKGVKNIETWFGSGSSWAESGWQLEECLREVLSVCPIFTHFPGQPSLGRYWVQPETLVCMDYFVFLWLLPDFYRLSESLKTSGLLLY